MANSVDHSVDDTVCRCVAAITQVSVSGQVSITASAHRPPAHFAPPGGMHEYTRKAHAKHLRAPTAGTPARGLHPIADSMFMIRRCDPTCDDMRRSTRK